MWFYRQSFRMTNLPRVINLIHLTVTTKICLTGRAHLQHPLLDRHLLRVSAVAQLQPVSIPDIVRDMAGKDPQRKIADFDSHYMPDGVQEPDVSVTGNTKIGRTPMAVHWHLIAFGTSQWIP